MYRPVFQFNAFQHLFHVFAGHGFVQFNLVYFVYAGGRVREASGKVAVVGKEQQAGGIAVEATDGVYPFGAGTVYQHHYRLAFLWVVDSGDESFGLVEQEVAFPLRAQCLASVVHHIAFLYLVAHFGNHFPVDGYTSGGNELVCLTSRTDAGVGNVFVQPRGSVVGLGGRRGSFLFGRWRSFFAGFEGLLGLLLLVAI